VAEKAELPLAVLRAAAAGLPVQRDAPLDERLFALECVARGGRETQPERQLLSPALLAAEDFIEDWEADVPHANVLGQALSTYAALDSDAPSDWSARLDETLINLGHRHAKHGITTTPLILASVIRGVTSGGLPIPRWLLDAARSYLESGPVAAPAAELAEALARHRSGQDLAHQFTHTVFARAHEDDPGAAIARWWLSERLAGMFGDVLGRDAIAAARIQALVSAPPANPRLAAMLTEISGRAVGTLVLLPADDLQRLRNERSRRAGVENIVWRTAAIVLPLVVLLIYLKPFLHWLGYTTPAAKALQAIAGGVTALAMIALWLGGLAIVQCLARKTDALMAVATVICAVIPLVVALLYPAP
jgi:hypothetical protein